MTRHRLPRLLLFAIVVAVCGFGSGRANAHSGLQSVIYLDITDSAMGGRAELPFGDLRTRFGLKLDGQAVEALTAELEAHRAELTAYIAEHLSIGAGGRAFELRYTDITLLLADGGYGVFQFLATVPGSSVPRQLDVRFDPFIDEIENRDALLLIGNDWKSGIIDNGEEVLLRFDKGTRTHLVDLGKPSQFKNFTASISQGVDHIRSGPDHVFFVLALLLSSVLVFTSAWNPVTGFGKSLWRILKVVTMFTLAHSITFVAAGLDVLPLPSSKIVESIIALSIAATALHNLRPVFRNREWLIAFIFGLFHGMGFARLVGGLDVSKGTKMVSLLGRNVGIEIGQAVVVLMIFPGLFLLRRTTWYRVVFTVTSIGLAIVALGWMIERLFEKDLRVSKLIEPIVEFPRSIVWAALGTAVAGAVFLADRQRGRLRPTVDPDSVGRDPDLALSGSNGAPR